MRKHEYGFSLLELLIGIAIVSAILTISIPGFKHLARNNQKKTSEVEFNKIYYNLIELITNSRNMLVKEKDGVIYWLTYPFTAPVQSVPGEYVDDINYESFCNYFLVEVFNKYDEFSGGTYYYEPVDYVNTTKNKAPNKITYDVKNKGTFIINVIITNSKFGSYDTLSIESLEYTDKYKNSFFHYV